MGPVPPASPVKLSSALVTAYAVLLALCGVALLFAPEEVGGLVEAGASGRFAQLFGCALFGFGSALWIARGTLLGGIYGRAVVGGLQAFTVTAALSLVSGLPASPTGGFWALLAVAVAGAVLFSWLLYVGPRMEAREA